MPLDTIDDIIMHRMMRLVARVLARGRLKMEVTGLNHVPERGPAILVARHYHHLFDGIALHWALPRRVHLLVTLDWAANSRTRFAMEALTRAARWPVVLRPDALARQKRGVFTLADLKRYQRKALRHSIELLREGRLLVIFPEGYPNVDPHYTPKTHRDETLPFKSGFVALAAAAEKQLDTTVPLIPVGFRYTEGKKWAVRVNFGKPRSIRDATPRSVLIEGFERDVALLSGLSRHGETCIASALWKV